MGVSGIAAEQALSQIKMGMAMMKSQQQAQMAIVEMVAATVDASRGQNLDVSV